VSVKYVRIFADEQGLSHFEDVELDLKRQHVADGVPPLQLAGPLAASGVLFVEQLGEQGDAAPWERHVTPSRRWIVVLEGELERVVSDGERRVFGPGDVVLREDTTGEGSLTTPRGDCVRFLMIPTGGCGDRERTAVNQQEMLAEFQRHRDAEIRRDLDAVIDTFVDDCYLETVALGTRSEGRRGTRVAYESYFMAFPDLDSDYQGFAAGDDVLVGWGVLSGTSGGEWLGLAPTGGHFAVRFTNVATFRDGRMAGESLYFDLATLCQQAGLSVDAVRAAAKAQAAPTP
jgi:steroid delta-isomerase-like uncharacterized protein